MRTPRSKTPAVLLAGLAMLGACSAAPAEPAGQETAAPRARLGVMSSLPLYWPLDAGIGDIAGGQAEVPWQRAAIERAFVLEPLDTLAAIPGLAPDAPETDPLAGLTRLAVIQPRGLSPTDNVALDEWVRAGGHLLMVLDPFLTGEYDLPLGDPRRPADTALIPPVVARWGLKVTYAAAAATAQNDYGTTALAGGVALPFAQPGRIEILPEGAGRCVRRGEGEGEGEGAIMATCRIGKGKVTLVADAALFEHPELAGAQGETLRAVLAEAFE